MALRDRIVDAVGSVVNGALSENDFMEFIEYVSDILIEVDIAIQRRGNRRNIDIHTSWHDKKLLLNENQEREKLIELESKRQTVLRCLRGKFDGNPIDILSAIQKITDPGELDRISELLLCHTQSLEDALFVVSHGYLPNLPMIPEVKNHLLFDISISLDPYCNPEIAIQDVATKYNVDMEMLFQIAYEEKVSLDSIIRIAKWSLKKNIVSRKGFLESWRTALRTDSRHQKT